MSEAERELGLGTIVTADDRSVSVLFGAAGETKTYAIRSAPLRRVKFAVGDTIADHGGTSLRVESLEEEDGLVVYSGSGRRLREDHVSDAVALAGPRERLLSGRTDKPMRFDLRLEALRRWSEISRSPVRGFVGPRLELLPHQFFIASAVSERPAPRVLLADETGLGKTIEACLTINRLLATGRASRVLILVPDSLVHQWLVELRRRFNLRFAIFDEERCDAIAQSEPGNPFTTEQLVLAGIGFVAGSETRSAEAAAAGWDIVVVDEAHHLSWEPGAPSKAYEVVERISAGSRGLLLLSATPQQLGEHGHFARLRLLDPDRYTAFDAWRSEADGYADAADVARRLAEGAELSRDELDRVAEFTHTSVEELGRELEQPEGKQRLLDRLIDAHGPGRVMFRNTRSAMPRFPSRLVSLEALEAEEPVRAAVRDELAAGLGLAEEPPYDFAKDPRIDALLARLDAIGDDKAIVFCATASKISAIKDAVENKRSMDLATFDEDMTLVQRDRNAAWFADPDGARVLLCSEIGSEGRNFQHAQHMIMFDLPLDPDLVEQRIGRLDRIGQTGDVHIHVPYLRDTGYEILARWHDEGIGVFSQATSTASAVLERFAGDVIELAGAAGNGDASTGERTAALCESTREAAAELAAEVEKGRDLLLEMASLRPERAQSLIEQVEEASTGRDLEDFFIRLLDSFRIYTEEIDPRCYLINPDAMRSTEFPSLDAGQSTVTFDRTRALLREDLEFVSWDHPLLADAVEHLLATDRGNASFALIEAPAPPKLVLEMVFVVEALAPARLHIERFLSPTPIRLMMDHKGNPVSEDVLESDEPLEMSRGKTDWILKRQDVIRKMLEQMIGAGEKAAAAEAGALRDAAAGKARDALGEETARLRRLAEVNPEVSLDEADLLAEELEEITALIASARLRLDCARLIWKGPVRDGAPMT